MERKNIFQDIPIDIKEEVFEIIALNKNIQIERIISKGHCSPPGFWYDQDKNEFVILLQGSACLKFMDEVLQLNPGDYVDIKSNVKHRIDWTDADCETIWLAIYY